MTREKYEGMRNLNLYLPHNKEACRLNVYRIPARRSNNCGLARYEKKKKRYIW